MYVEGNSAGIANEDIFDDPAGGGIPARRHWSLSDDVPAPGERQPVEIPRTADRIRTAGPELHPAGVLSSTAIRGGQRRLRCDRVGRKQFRTDEPETGGADQGVDR